ncbi:MAG TPA: LLM class flavin-dependent oxidoreductase [Trebonia sp.]|jgi:alkanesulfonate monooxygenase SsuD/methylene tetrahydromethanopterin reductase-like flavin-dependent oxidoreductase (luciferase family)
MPVTGTSIGDIDIAIGTSEFTRAELVLIARVADDLGVGTVFLTEGPGRDPFSVLTEMALETSRVGLGTGIVNVFSRTPTALAQSTASVMELMGSRPFYLGLGTSGRQLMQKYHGVPFDRPVSRLRETIEIIDTAFRTGSLPDGGDIFPLGGLPLGLEAPRDRLKILVAGLSPRTLEVTGTCADGWLPIWLSREHGSGLLHQVEAAAAAAGRPRPLVAAYFYGGVGADPDLIAQLRATLAWYVAGNGTAYRALFERYGYVAETKAICDQWSSGARADARARVPDQLLDDTTLYGPPADFLRRAAGYIRLGVDRPVLRLLGRLGAARCVQMLGELAAAGKVETGV